MYGVASFAFDVLPHLFSNVGLWLWLVAVLLLEVLVLDTRVEDAGSHLALAVTSSTPGADDALTDDVLPVCMLLMLALVLLTKDVVAGSMLARS